MGKVLKVTPEELEKASKSLSDMSKTYSDIYKQLLQKASTMGEAWEGEDNRVFVEQINGFCEELKAMADKLQISSDALMKQKTNYSNRQDTNIAGARKLAN